MSLVNLPPAVWSTGKFFAEFYERVVALKAKGVKVLVAIGGWNDSAGDKYSRLVNSASARRRFVENVLTFIEKYEFDGLDLDWEYPVCWQVQCADFHSKHFNFHFIIDFRNKQSRT